MNLEIIDTCSADQVEVGDSICYQGRDYEVISIDDFNDYLIFTVNCLDEAGDDELILDYDEVISLLGYMD